jgi:hypothetical protein
MGLRDIARKVIGRGRPEAPRSAPPPAAPPAAPSAAARPQPAAAPEAAAEEKPWYLQGTEDLEGWDETNPGEEPGKKNLRS